MIELLQTWRESVLPLNSTVKDSIVLLGKISHKIILIINEDDSIKGTISDGDIRRGLLKGLELSSSIESIINFSPWTVFSTVNKKSVFDLMVTNKLLHVPVIDSQKRVVGLYVWDEINIPKVRPNIMVIMAGGKGTRLMPHTDNCPKPLLKVSGKPILEHIILRARNQGFHHFILAIHYLGEMIEEYFGNGDKFGIKIEYLHEESPLGTVGALSLVKTIPKEPLIITNGDTITKIGYGDIVDFHNFQQAAATMAVRSYELQNQFGVVETSGIEVIGYEEKPIYRSNINAGVYVIEPSSLKYLVKHEPTDMPNLLNTLREKNNKVIAYHIHEDWHDIGRPYDLLSIESEI